MRGAAPEAVTENTAVWPAVSVWLVGCMVIEGVTGTPAPVMVIVATWSVTIGAFCTLALLACREVNSILVIERLPETLPTPVGAKLAVTVAFCPGTNVNGSDVPLILKPLPDAVICVTVKVVVPEFVRVRF